MIQHTLNGGQKGYKLSRRSRSAAHIHVYCNATKRASSSVQVEGQSHPATYETVTFISEAPPKTPLQTISALFLPEGYPNTVTRDYLEYQLWSFPTHISGWLSISLTTSSLLKAVGLDVGAVGVAATAAAIKWIIKDGVGAAGRFFVGSKFGAEFDDDPRRWRMIAEFVSSTGLALEIFTAIFPGSFLILASSGNFVRAVGKGMGKPVFRVIQNHFASTGNVGAIAAKEEVWEVCAQLVGYALSVLLLQQLERTGAGSWQTVVGIWATFQTLHVALRYRALSSLRFSYLNMKRAAMLAMDHVQGKPLQGIDEVNQREPLLLPGSSLPPFVTWGCSITQAWQGGPPPDASQVQGVLLQYDQEAYALVWQHQTKHAYILLKPEVDERALLRAVWQAAWLTHHSHLQLDPASAARAGLEALSQQFDGFVAEAQSQGWETDNVKFKLGAQRLMLKV